MLPLRKIKYNSLLIHNTKITAICQEKTIYNRNRKKIRRDTVTADRVAVLQFFDFFDTIRANHMVVNFGKVFTATA